MKDYEPLDDNDDPGGQKCAGQHPLQQAIQMTSPQTTFPIGPDTRVPWPCWLEVHGPSDRRYVWQWYERWPFPAHPSVFGCRHYSTLPSDQRPDEPTPVSSDLTPGAQALERVCEAAARETTGAFVQDPGRTIGEFVAATTAILRRHFAPEFERVQREMDEAKNNLEGARRVNARLTQVDFRNADLIEKLQEERDDLRADRKKVIDMLNEAATTGGFDGYDESTELWRSFASHIDRLKAIFTKELDAYRAAIDAARAAGREGK